MFHQRFNVLLGVKFYRIFVQMPQDGRIMFHFPNKGLVSIPILTPSTAATLSGLPSVVVWAESELQACSSSRGFPS